MPWSEPHAAALRALGVHWARGQAQDTAELTADAKPSAARATTRPAPAPAAAVRAMPAPLEFRPTVPMPAPPVAAAPPLASSVAGLDWSALRHAVAECRACRLCETRTQTVFGVGYPRAHWMIVGEAPGEQEDLRGEPFVGAAGRLLDQMLRALQLTRSEPADATLAAENPDALGARHVYIANTLKCRPPGNRNPQADELERCEAFLVRQIELLRPRIILAMGRFAVQSLLRSAEPVGRLRGRVHAYQGVPLVVTYHPAYLLRNPADKARAWDDLCLAAATLEAA
jgi:DNA polymerase